MRTATWVDICGGDCLTTAKVLDEETEMQKRNGAEKVMFQGQSLAAPKRRDAANISNN